MTNWARLYTIKLKIKELQEEYEKLLDDYFEKIENLDTKKDVQKWSSRIWKNYYSKRHTN